MHWWMLRDLKKHSGQVALDLGCGSMRNRPYFQAPRYIGVDMDAERLAEGRRRYPGAEAHRVKVEEFRLEGGADIVACIQVLFNVGFDPAVTLQAVENAISLTRPGGCFIFTIAKENLRFESDIDSAVRLAFEQVEKVPFGRLDFVSRFALPIGFLASLSRTGWEPADPAQRRVYYYCSRRREE
jgi:SAM-dependent methyltransferase